MSAPNRPPLFMNKPLYVLNGPNLNRLGQREPEVYGRMTLADIEAVCREAAGARALAFRQSNHEGQIVEWIHEAIEQGAGTSVAIVDALKMFPGPIIELHITNIHRRDAMYQHSLVSKVATAVIAGLGGAGYGVAVRALAGLVEAAAPAS